MWVIIYLCPIIDVFGQTNFVYGRNFVEKQLKT